jgi:hypothetical protein
MLFSVLWVLNVVPIIIPYFNMYLLRFKTFNLRIFVVINETDQRFIIIPLLI